MDDNKDWYDELPEVPLRVYTTGDTKSQDTDPFLQNLSELKELDGTTPVFKRRMSRKMEKYQRGSDGQAGTKRVEVENETITAYNAFEAVLPPYNPAYLARLYELAPAHYAAVNAKVSNIVGLGYKLVESKRTKRRIEDLDGQQEKLTNVRKKLMRARDELEDVLESFNEEDTLVETLIKVWRDYETTGNGYLEVGRKRDGTVGYLGHIPAVTIRLRRKRDGFVQIIGKEVIFFRNFGDKTTTNPFGNDDSPNEIIHVKKYSPSSTFYGVPDIVAATQAVAGNEFAAQYNLDYFSNKAVPRYAIISKGVKLGTQTQSALLSFFETSLKGQNHRSIFIPLPADTDKAKVDLRFEAIEAKVQDSSFKEYRKANTMEILTVHRVPVTKVGLPEGVNLAVARDADKTFKEQVCAPEQRIFERKLNNILKDMGVDSFEFKLNEMTLTDADTQSKIDERDIKNQIRVPNEIRADRGLPGRKGGDKPVELKPQQAADARAQGTRARDAARSAGATDSAGEGRNPKGEGRTTS